MKKVMVSVFTALSLLTSANLFAVTFADWNDGDTITVHLENKGMGACQYDFSAFMHSFNSSAQITANPPSTELSGTIPAGQTISFSSTLTTTKTLTPYQNGSDLLYWLNYPNTADCQSSPVINGLPIPLHLWGSSDEGCGGGQYINIITNDTIQPISNTSEEQTVYYYGNTSLTLDGGGNSLDMNNIWFHVDIE